MSTYSTKLFAGVLPTSFTEARVAQANEVLVIRDMEFYNGGAGTPTFNVQAGVPGSTTVVFQISNLATSTHLQWQGRAVIEPGEGLWVFSSASGVQAYISGYSLIG